MTITIEAGECYEDADGNKRGPIKRVGDKCWVVGHGGENDPEWDEHGKALIGDLDLVAIWVDEPAPAETPETDIKAHIADTAKSIVSGARRSAYGTPEQNFERIAALWSGYATARDWGITFTAADVSPLMILMKLARLAETPDHLDSAIDGVGYFLTLAEVNGIKP